jgi:adenylylsulfate kinase-like enzyme
MFPGVSSPYEPPAAPDLVLETDKLGVDHCVEKILALLESKGAVG